MSRTILVIAATVLAGCARQNPATVGAPSSAAVRDQIHQASSSARSASESIKASTEENRAVKGALRKIDDKLIIIDRWIETQPRPKP